MDETIAAIYGTCGAEKVASPGGSGAYTLFDLAAQIVAERFEHEANAPVEKIASAHQSTLEDLVEFDRSGRAIAHQQFSEMETAAMQSGDMSQLEAFFADMG